MLLKIFNSRFYARIAPWTILTVIMSLPFLLQAVRGAMQTSNNDVRQWLPDGFRETREYDEFLSRFGSEEMAVVSWPGCVVGDAQLDRFAAELTPLVGEPSTTMDHLRPLFKRVLTTNQAIDELTREPTSVSRDEALRRLNGLLVGRDGRTAALIVMINEAGAANRLTAVEEIRLAAERSGIPRSELRLAGPTIDSVALQTESQKSRYLLAAISVVVAISLAWRSLRNARLALMVFTTALLGAGINVACVYWNGGTMNLLLGMMPTLTYLLGLSGAVHLVNYYRETVRDEGAEGAPLRAVRAAWLPCFLSAATTAVGLGSLGFSDVVPVRLFGLYSALGVLITLPVLYLFLPSLLQLWPVVEAVRPATAIESQAGPPSMRRLVNWVIGHHTWVVGASLLLLAVGVLGVTRLNTSVKLLNLFSPQSKIIQDYAWLEENLGPMVPVEIMLRFDAQNTLTSLERLELVARVEQRLNNINKVGGTMSAATFAPPIPKKGGVGTTTRRKVFERRIEAGRANFVNARYLQTSDDGELWRISARVEALNSIDYGHFVAALRDEVEPILQETALRDGGHIEAVYTGLVPLIYKAQRTLLNDLLSSFVSAFFLIGLMMMVLLRNVRAGLVSMIPNVFPAIVLFGFMGISGMLCDIGSMMTAGAAMGIAVDDTIHFLAWFRRSRAPGRSREDIVRRAHAHCSVSMIQSTIICGVGILVFSLSAFVPTSRFAWLMAAMLGAGLVGDLILLPALLVGPFGKFFGPSDAEPVMSSEASTTKEQARSLPSWAPLPT